MKKLSESVWMDIHKRSTGEGERQEDAFHPDYIDFGPDTTVYWAVNNLEIDGEGKLSFEDVKDYNNNGWRLPTLEEVNQVNWDNIRTPWYDHCTHLLFPDGNELKLKRESNNGFHMWASDYDPKFPSCAQSYGFDNMSKFNTDSFNINWNKLYVFLVKSKRQVNESVWMDIHKRSNNEIERREERVDIMGKDGFFKYLHNHYESLTDQSEIVTTDGMDKIMVTAYINEHNNRVYMIYSHIDDPNIQNTLLIHVGSSNPLYQKLKTVFSLSSTSFPSSTFINPKGKPLTNSFFLDVLDFILDNVEAPNKVALRKI